MTFSEFTKPYGPRRNPASKRFHDLAQRRLWPIRSHFLPPLPPRAAANPSLQMYLVRTQHRKRIIVLFHVGFSQPLLTVLPFSQMRK